MQYFGYGSLVNRDTRPSGEGFAPGIIAGWQRRWAHRVVGAQAHVGFSVLTVEPAPAVDIEGVLVPISLTDLPHLDRREKGYERRSLELSCDAESVSVYVSCNALPASEQYPLLQSYVDCVLAGYLAVFGWDGVARFFATTQGWEAPIINDRMKPLYPRAVKIDDATQREFDDRIVAARQSAVKNTGRM